MWEPRGARNRLGDVLKPRGARNRLGNVLKPRGARNRRTTPPCSVWRPQHSHTPQVLTPSTPWCLAATLLAAPDASPPLYLLRGLANALRTFPWPKETDTSLSLRPTDTSTLGSLSR